MKAIRNLTRALLVILILAMLVLPLYLIYLLSVQEMAAYADPPEVNIQLGAYGSIVSPAKMDVAEFAVIEGTVVASDYAFQELDIDKPYLIRWLVNSGQTVSAGQTLGFYKETPITAEVTGMIREISLNSEDPYIRYDVLDRLLVECDLDSQTLALLQSSDELRTDMDENVTVVSASDILQPDGTVKVRLDIQDRKLSYGQRLEDMRIYTGRVFPNSLVLPINCVYQKHGEDGDKWYARQVSGNGAFLEETEVQLGFSTGEYVSVFGVQEGQFFDSGYGSIAGEGVQ